MARRFQSRAPRRGPRRATDWIGGVQTGQTAWSNIAATSAAIISAIDTRTGLTPSSPYTITRIRGLLMVSVPSLSVDIAGFGAYGICIVNGEAFDAGVGSIISPWLESFDDRWFYHTYFGAIARVDVIGTDAGASATMGSNIVIDSRAQRKIETGDVLVSVIENPTGVSLDYFVNFRTFVKLV